MTADSGIPPMPISEAEWAAHWAFYKLTVMQRDAAWRALARLDGCTCGGIGETGAHRRDCPWSMSPNDGKVTP